MTLAMSVTRCLLRLRHKSTATEQSMRASLNPRRPAAKIPARLAKAYDVAIDRIDGRDVVRIAPKSVAPSRELIYIHGGSYIHEIDGLHWGIVARLLEKTQAAITVPLYGLAPEKTAEDAYGLLKQVYDATRQRANGNSIFLVGDSAGAGLAIGLAITVRDDGTPPPSHLILFSPWVDVTLSNREIGQYERLDPVLGVAGLRAAGVDWAGSWSPEHRLVSPLNDSLQSLPPMTIFQGGRDIFLPDVRRFASAARASGTPIDLLIYPTAFHVFVAAPWTPEARSALDRTRAIIRDDAATATTVSD
jgi:acetyl esterase/lipase